MTSEIAIALDTLTAQRDALKAVLEADERWQQLHRLESAIAVLRGEAGPTGSGGLSNAPALAVGRPAARGLEDRSTNPLLAAILHDHPDRTWKVEELVTEMNRRGWETDAENRRNALGTALLRMSKRGEAEKVGRARYRAAVTPAMDAPPLDEADDSLGIDDSALQATGSTESTAIDSERSHTPSVPRWSEEVHMGG